MRRNSPHVPAYEHLSSETHSFPLHQSFRILPRRFDEAKAAAEAPAISLSADEELQIFDSLQRDISGFEILEAMKYTRGKHGDS